MRTLHDHDGHHLDLTPQEREADLDLEQLKQLVGLVEYDESKDPFPVTGWDAIVFVVGNATQTAHYYQSAWGMELVAYTRPGERPARPQVVRPEVRARSGSSSTARSAPTARSSPTTPSTVTASSTSRSRCPTSTSASPRPGAAGARVVREAEDVTDEHGTVRIAAIATYGETVHTLVDRSRYDGPYLPGYVARQSTWVKRDGAPKRLFQALDHIVGNVELGKMDEWVDLLQQGHGLREHGRVHR